MHEGHMKLRRCKSKGQGKKTASHSLATPSTLLPLTHKVKGLFTGYNHQGRNRVNKPYALSDFLLQLLL